LFFGAFADNLNATTAVSEIAIRYYKEQGEMPDRKTIVEKYYGEYVDKANIFIGFDRLAAFDYPLINWGEEDLYFTVSPSLYLDKSQLRCILFDHLYTRRTPEREYETLTREEYISIQKYYRENKNNIIGIGKLHNGFWIPIGQ
jgi:tuberculosinol/isotuberculosinol synthase